MCKKEDFGNCDPETADQEYCIFHKPNKSEEEAVEFYRKFLERFKPRVEETKVNGQKVKRLVFEEPVDVSGYVFPEIPKGPIEYVDADGNEWNQRFTFENAVFKNHVSFYQATFEGIMSFKKATFKKFACFAKVTFHRFTSFDFASFEFQTTEITDNKLIRLFNELTLLCPRLYPVSIPGHMELLAGTVFFKVVFNNGASFYMAKFRGITDFRDSEFRVSDYDELFIYSDYHKWAITGVTFNEASFEYALFERAKFYAGCEFNQINANWLSFEKCKFGGDNEVSSLFRDSELGGIDFSGSEFRGSVIFTQSIFKGIAKFYNVKFNASEGMVVAFNGAKFYDDADFYKATFNVAVNFNDSCFYGKTGFQGCVFEQQAEFYRATFKGNETSFASSTFKGVVHFEFAEFGKTTFNFAVFENGASFKNAKFEGDALFWELTILKPLEFHDATFKSKAEFLRCKFRDAVEFSEASFNDVSFDWSLFEGIAELTAVYHGKASFKRSTFHLGVQIDWDRVKVERIESKKELIRIYVATLKQEGRIREATKVALQFRKELNQYKRKKGRLKERIQAYFEWIIFDLPTDYLTNSIKAFKSSILIVLVFAFLYWGISFTSQGAIYSSSCVFSPDNLALNTNINFTSTFDVELNGSKLDIQGLSISNVSDQKIVTLTGCIRKNEESEIKHLFDYLYFSLVTFTTLGYGDFHPVGILKILAGIEAFLGVLFAAMISAILGKELFVEEFEE